MNVRITESKGGGDAAETLYDKQPSDLQEDAKSRDWPMQCWTVLESPAGPGVAGAQIQTPVSHCEPKMTGEASFLNFIGPTLLGLDFPSEGLSAALFARYDSASGLRYAVTSWAVWVSRLNNESLIWNRIAVACTNWPAR